jgi:CBS domain-containing protein
VQPSERVQSLGLIVNTLAPASAAVSKRLRKDSAQALAPQRGNTAQRRCPMTPDPVTLPIGASEEEALTAMRDHHIRRLPLVESERVVGIVTLG